MCQLIETILIKNKKPQFLSLHERRMNYTRKKLFSLNNLLSIPKVNIEDNGLYRLRISYSKSIDKVEVLPYIYKKKRTLSLVEANFNYSFKYKDRSVFDDLLTKNQQSDDILIVKNDRITDTSIANCAFYDGKRWFTPSVPLFKGVTRERLIKSKFLFPKKIEVRDLTNYSHIALLNALSGFYIAGEVERVIDVK